MCRWTFFFLLIASTSGPIACKGHSQASADAVIPPRPTDAGGVSRGSVETFALDSVFLGETDRSGASSTAAWRRFGYDLDGLTTGLDSTNVCTLTVGASPSNQIDGNGGIDNAMGSILTPILDGADKCADAF